MVVKRSSWLLVAILFAGCLGLEDAARSSEGSAKPSSTADAASGTGAIEVTVVTGELDPVEGAEVVLHETPHAAYTDAQGAARFNGLEAGTYTVIAAKPGYKAVQERGRAVDVLPDEVTSVRLAMEPIQLVTPETSYSKTIPFSGFMTCSFYGALIGYTSYCGRGITTTSGQQIGDPNDKTIHPWDVENALIETILWEVKWTPSQATLGTQLWARVMATLSCQGTTGQSCEPYDQIEGKGGKSPLIVRDDDGEKDNITRKISTYNKGVYPYKVYNEVRAWCNSATAGGDCYLTLMVNQKYDGWQTAFYGGPAPAGFTALPPG